MTGDDTLDSTRPDRVGRRAVMLQHTYGMTADAKVFAELQKVFAEMERLRNLINLYVRRISELERDIARQSA